MGGGGVGCPSMTSFGCFSMKGCMCLSRDGIGDFGWHVVGVGFGSSGSCSRRTLVRTSLKRMGFQLDNPC